MNVPTKFLAIPALMAMYTSPLPAQQSPAQQLPAQQLPAQQLPAQQLPAQQLPAELRSNPFSRPAYTTNLDAVADPVLLAAPVALELRATMVGTGSAFANINGRLLRAGEEIDGYRVLRIGEGQAVLRRDGERLTLSVYEQQRGSDDLIQGQPVGRGE